MPKFLDAPSWYDAGGRETNGWGLTPYYPQGDLLSNLPTGRYLLVGPSGTGLVSELTLNIQNSSGTYQAIKIKAGASWTQYGNSNGIPCIMTVYNDLSTTGALNLFFENVMSQSSTYGAIVPTSCGIYRGARMYLHFTRSGSGYVLSDSWGYNAGSTNGYSIFNGSAFFPTSSGASGTYLKSNGMTGMTWDTPAAATVAQLGTLCTPSQILGNEANFAFVVAPTAGTISGPNSKTFAAFFMFYDKKQSGMYSVFVEYFWVLDYFERTY